MRFVPRTVTCMYAQLTLSGSYFSIFFLFAVLRAKVLQGMSQGVSSTLSREMCSVHILVSGRVQGVFFRKYTRRAARELGLVGWVRNLSEDERVEIIAEGPKSRLESLVEWCSTKGSPHSQVEGVEFEFSPATGGFLSFDVLGTW